MIQSRSDFVAAWNAQLSDEQLLRVRWLLRADSQPVRSATIRVCRGHVTDIRATESADSSVPAVVMTPQLVNVHTHLEFSSLTQPIGPPRPFTEWIRSVIAWRTDRASAFESMDSRLAAESVLLAGIDECWRSGTQLIGDIDTQGTCRLPRRSDIQVLSFLESIGLTQSRVDAALRAAEAHVQSAPSGSSGQTDSAMLSAPTFRGLSPHAPYSVAPDLLAGLTELAEKHNVPLAMHLAETTDELQLLESGTGRFQEFLDAMGLWSATTFPGDRSILRILQMLRRVPRVLAVHGNYFGNQELAFLREHPTVTTVYCPRTHEYFGHPAHPWQRLLDAGARVVLATDGRSSNPDLNVWNELQHLLPSAADRSIPQLLRMITTDALEAVGADPAACRIEVGRPLNAVLMSFHAADSVGLHPALAEQRVAPVVRFDHGIATCLEDGWL